MFFAVWDFIFSRSSFKSVLPMAFTCAVQTSTGASRRANRAGLQLRWCRSPTRPPKLHTRPHRAGLGLRWCRFPTLGSNRHTGANRAEFGFSPQNALTPPPKGGGAGYRLSWVCWVYLARSKLGHAGPTGPVWGFAGVVLLPSHLTGHKSPHRGEFGFGLLAGASQEDHPPFRQSRIRTQAEEKNTSAPLF